MLQVAFLDFSFTKEISVCLSSTGTVFGLRIISVNPLFDATKAPCSIVSLSS